MKKIKSALISVFYKDGLELLVKNLYSSGVKMYSTGGTEKFIKNLGIEVENVENVTRYPSILGGRVKTLHPKIFGGILYRRENKKDTDSLSMYNIPEIDLVVVDLYPFEETVLNIKDQSEIIEKIDIGGISLIRAAAKNFQDVVVLPSIEYYSHFLDIFNKNNGSTSIEDRKYFATKAFEISFKYDYNINRYFNFGNLEEEKILRYGENPHQKGVFKGNLEDVFIKHSGKELSYNNLLDIDSAVNLIQEFQEPTFAIIKHNNACGISSKNNIYDAYLDALSCDPQSAFGGILVSNRILDEKTAEEINKLFFEVIISKSYQGKALEILKTKQNRIILEQKKDIFTDKLTKTCLNGILIQDRDYKTENKEDLNLVTLKDISESQKEDLIFALKICKHTKSNAIVLVKDKKLLAAGIGQTSRVDSLNQAIDKALKFKFDLKGSVMASDAFFPFPDVVEIASEEGIIAIVQPGGSIKDNLSIDKCDEKGMAMFFTGIRHFKH